MKDGTSLLLLSSQSRRFKLQERALELDNKNGFLLLREDKIILEGDGFPPQYALKIIINPGDWIFPPSVNFCNAKKLNLRRLGLPSKC